MLQEGCLLRARAPRPHRLRKRLVKAAGETPALPVRAFGDFPPCNYQHYSYINKLMTDSSDYSHVVELLRVESEAIAKAAARLDASQLAGVLSILENCKGKVIVLGVGKSGIIAQKIA